MLKQLLNNYTWYDHPEGLKFVETHRDEFRTSGNWLLLPGAISAFHRVLNNAELWIIQHGSIKLHILGPDGQLVTHKLGLNLEDGEESVVSVPVGYWQAAELETKADFGFGAVICAPAFAFTLFEMAPRAALVKQHPQHEELIRRLTLE